MKKKTLVESMVSSLRLTTFYSGGGGAGVSVRVSREGVGGRGVGGSGAKRRCVSYINPLQVPQLVSCLESKKEKKKNVVVVVVR